MIDFIKEAESKDIDFRKTTAGKGSRKRNIAESAPVKVQKGKKIEVSDEERSLKTYYSKKTQEELVRFTNSLITALDVQNKRKEKVKNAKRKLRKANKTSK